MTAATHPPICRIGVFYDGTYFIAGARHFYFHEKKGWPQLKELHSLIEEFIRKEEAGLYQQFRVVHSAWFQGRFNVDDADADRLRMDRLRDFELMRAGVEAHFMPMTTSKSRARTEKGTDVSLALEALEIGLTGTVDVVALVAGDGDFVPLVRKLMRKGIRTGLLYFEAPEQKLADGKEIRPCFANPALIEVSNYSLNLNAKETQKEFQSHFRMLFKKPEKY